MEINFENGVHHAGVFDVEDARRLAQAAGFHTFVLPAEGVIDRRSFFDAIRATLPLDPPAQGSSWDALSDSLWEGLAEDPGQRIAILWPNSGAMATSAPADFELALSVLADVATLLADPRATCDRPKQVVVVVE